jgi:hypothetical protein
MIQGFGHQTRVMGSTGGYRRTCTTPFCGTCQESFLSRPYRYCASPKLSLKSLRDRDIGRGLRRIDLAVFADRSDVRNSDCAKKVNAVKQCWGSIRYPSGSSRGCRTLHGSCRAETFGNCPNPSIWPRQTRCMISEIAVSSGMRRVAWLCCCFAMHFIQQFSRL